LIIKKYNKKENALLFLYIRLIACNCCVRTRKRRRTRRREEKDEGEKEI
jgi:hypothetical protein